MATTTATITLSSADLTGDTLALSTTATLTKAGTATGMDQTTGVARKTYTQDTSDILIDGADYADNKAHKIYLKNVSTTVDEYFDISFGSSTAADVSLGRLYAGDWAFFPYNGVDSNDLIITPSVDTTMVLEYMVIYQS